MLKQTTKHWVQTIQGQGIDLEAIEPQDFNIPMIAHQLGMLCRFNGAVHELYSVAEHSVMCSRIALRKYGNKPLAQYMLLHDAHECITGDITAPVKRLLGANLGILEEAIDQAIAERFGLADVFYAPGLISIKKTIDHSVMMWEKKFLCAPEPRPWGIEYDISLFPKHEPKCWPPGVAATYFNEQANKLGLS